jgi:hypothetical protein
VLLYQVGGEPYASPLANVREVLDRAVAGEPAVFEGQVLNVLSLRDVFGVEQDAECDAGARSLLVVKVPGSDDLDGSDENGTAHAGGIPPMVAFAVDAVQGMAVVEAVYGVPEGITGLPERSILGAFLAGAIAGGPAPSAPTGQASATRAEVGRWLADDRSMSTYASRDEPLAGADPELGAPGQIVLVIDLARLARCGRPQGG